MVDRFVALRKVRDRQFDQAQQYLAKARARLHALRDQEARLRQEAAQLLLPSRGEGRLLAMFVAQKEAIATTRKRLADQIAAAQDDVQKAKEALQKAHLALEQAKALESQALKALLVKRQKASVRQLDEIASIRFWKERASKGRDG